MPVLESSSDTKYQLQLPTVSFRVIDDKSLEQPAGVSSVRRGVLQIDCKLIARVKSGHMDVSRRHLSHRS